MKTHFTLPLTLFFSLYALCQSDSTTVALTTDRPDATEASNTVPKGSIQIETGGLYSSFENNGITDESFVYNTTLLRYGLLDNFEIRVGWNLLENRTTINNSQTVPTTSGFSPLLLGMKVAITEEKGWIPEIALIGHIFLPLTASSDFKPEFTSTDFRFSLSHTLSERASLGYNLGAQWGPESPEAAYVYTISYGYSINDRWGFYVESYGDLPEDSSANHLVDGGITYLLKPLMQLDAYVGTGLTEGQDILVGAGISFRIDKK